MPATCGPLAGLRPNQYHPKSGEIHRDKLRREGFCSHSLDNFFRAIEEIRRGKQIQGFLVRREWPRRCGIRGYVGRNSRDRCGYGSFDRLKCEQRVLAGW